MNFVFAARLSGVLMKSISSSPSGSSMILEAAFLSPQADDLFESVAAFADAPELDKLDVTSGQSSARKALGRVIGNAAQRRPSPGTRIALIKGEAGSG